MINEIKGEAQGNEIISKWSPMFNLEHLNIQFKWATFEFLNAPGINFGTFKSSLRGGFKGEPIAIYLLNDWKKYNQNQVRNDELEIVNCLIIVRGNLDRRSDWYY